MFYTSFQFNICGADKTDHMSVCRGKYKFASWLLPLCFTQNRFIVFHWFISLESAVLDKILTGFDRWSKLSTSTWNALFIAGAVDLHLSFVCIILHANKSRLTSSLQMTLNSSFELKWPKQTISIIYWCSHCSLFFFYKGKSSSKRAHLEITMWSTHLFTMANKHKPCIHW